MIVFLPYHTINCHYNYNYKSLYKVVHTNYYKDVTQLAFLTTGIAILGNASKVPC